MKLLLLLSMVFSFGAFAQSEDEEVDLLESEIAFAEIKSVKVEIIKNILFTIYEDEVQLVPSNETEPWCSINLNIAADEEPGKVLRGDKNRTIIGGIDTYETADEKTMYEIYPFSEEETVSSIECFNIKKPSDIAKGLGDYAEITATPYNVDDFKEVNNSKKNTLDNDKA